MTAAVVTLAAALAAAIAAIAGLAWALVRETRLRGDDRVTRAEAIGNAERWRQASKTSDAQRDSFRRRAGVLEELLNESEAKFAPSTLRDARNSVLAGWREAADIASGHAPAGASGSGAAVLADPGAEAGTAPAGDPRVPRR